MAKSTTPALAKRIKQVWDYPGDVLSVIDGDTVVIRFDHGLDMYSTRAVRLLGCQAPERSGKTKAAGLAAKAWLAAKLEGRRVLVRTWRNAKEAEVMTFNRYLAQVWIYGVDLDEPDISAQLIAAKHAVPWDGKGPRPAGV